MKNTNILIVGATTGIGRAAAEIYIKRGCKVAVTGRREALLLDLKKLAPQNVFTYTNDVIECKAEAVFKQILADMGGVDTVLICAGMGEINLELNFEHELNTARTNVLGFTDWAVAAMRHFEDTKKPSRLGAISSIASFRGSDAAPAYYASKAYVSNYLEGLRKRAFKSKLPISVTTVIPGFVNTALAKDVGGEGLFWVAPVEKAAVQIVRALDEKKDFVYVTNRWRLVAWAMKSAPFWLYKRFY